MAAGAAQAQMDPGAADLQALLAAECARASPRGRSCDAGRRAAWPLCSLARDQRVEAPRPRPGEGQIEEDKTIKNSALAAIKHAGKSRAGHGQEISKAISPDMMKAATRENRPTASSAPPANSITPENQCRLKSTGSAGPCGNPNIFDRPCSKEQQRHDNAHDGADIRGLVRHIRPSRSARRPAHSAMSCDACIVSSSVSRPVAGYSERPTHRHITNF